VRGPLTLSCRIERKHPRLPRFFVVPARALAGWRLDGTTVTELTLNDVEAGRHSLKRWDAERWFVELPERTCRRAGVDSGDRVRVCLRVASEALPPELARRIAEDPPSKAAWSRLSASRRRMVREHVIAAKTPAARRRRAARALGPAQAAELWRCPRCGAGFTTRNQWHSCGRFDLERLFAGKPPQVRALYRRLLGLIEACSPVTVIPQRSRVAFQVRMRFAAVTPLKSGLKGHLILASRQQAACFDRVESLTPRSHLHAFRLALKRQLPDEFAHWVREAYRYKVGRQEHLKRIC
jgi:hypothetical protein